MNILNTNRRQLKQLVLDASQEIYEKETGYIIYTIDKNSCIIDYIEVDNHKKNCGEGTKLLECFFDKFKSENIDFFYLEALVTEKAVFDLKQLICFYEKFGFKEYDRFEDDVLRIYMSLKV